MKELYILAKKLGFKPQNLSISWKTDSYLWMCELQKWLREEHKLIVSINIMSDLSYYSLLINIDEDKLNLSNQSQNRGFITYEEALEDGLLEGLKLIK